MTNLYDLQILVDRFHTNIEFYKDIVDFEINLDMIPGKKEKKFYYKDNS